MSKSFAWAGGASGGVHQSTCGKAVGALLGDQNDEFSVGILPALHDLLFRQWPDEIERS